MSEIPVKDEHRAALDYYIEKISDYETDLLVEQQGYEDAMKMSQCLYGAQQTLVKLNLGISDAATMRNAEILSHFINKARKCDEESAFYRDTISALREALSLFIAHHYEIDITQEIKIDIDKGVILHGAP